MSQVEDRSTGGTTDRLMLALSVAALLAGIVSFHQLEDASVWARAGALIAGIVAAVVLGLLSQSGKRFVGFSQDAVNETRKVVWPTRKETIQTTLIVFVFVFVMALFLWLADKALEWVLYDLILARALQERIDRAGMQDHFGQILVPVEEVVEIRGGQKAISERRFFPGYVLVEMDMNEQTWHLVKNTNKVTGFVGGTASKPTPISQAEVDKIMAQMQEGVEKPRPKVLFEVGEVVRVKEGPFTDFNGSVEEVNYEKNRMRVSVTIFGRATPVELEFGQVEKL